MIRAGSPVLITGASSGIGLEAARLLARQGARLFLVGRDATRLQSAADELCAVPLVADLTSADDIKGMVAAVFQRAGRLDALVNCAGQLEVGPVDQLGEEVVERLLQVNFLGSVRAIQGCLPLLRVGRSAVIVNVSSVAGRVAPPFMAAYAASKFALHGYTQALRQELRSEGIHVGLVVPGPVETPMVEGRLGGPFYPLPVGVPVLKARQVALAINTVISQRRAEVILPKRLGFALRLGAAYPFLVDLLYRGVMRGERRRTGAGVDA